MLVQSKWPHGEHEVRCSQVQVPVHETCKCGCRLRREDCNKHQYYHEPSCRYIIIFLVKDLSTVHCAGSLRLTKQSYKRT